jgi:hypothetical protein
MLRRDPKGRFLYTDRYRPTKARFYQFHSGSSHAEAEWDEKTYLELVEYQETWPAVVMTDPATNTKWWLFQGVFYYENEGYTNVEVKALALDKRQQRERKIGRAMARVAQGAAAPASARGPIPDDVKTFVWQRDRGQCVRCGSKEKLEFDHIVPIAKGGSNTARNIQLLCETCNRAKGADLF